MNPSNGVVKLGHFYMQLLLFIQKIQVEAEKNNK